MLPSKIIEKKIATFPEDFQAIALELRNLVYEIVPEATEQIHSKGMTYFLKERGGPVSAGICGISLFLDHVELSFNHGTFIDDPKEILIGNTIAKRHLNINEYANADWDYFKFLIRQHVELDPTSEATQEMIRKKLQDQ